MPTSPPSPILRITLWLTQALLALLFVGTGIYKLLKPTQLPWPWTQQHPALVTITGVVDIVGGLGIILPTLTGIRPGLARLAALGLAALQVSAIVFHFLRGEAANTPFNFGLLALALFVWWGRGRAASSGTAS